MSEGTEVEKVEGGQVVSGESRQLVAADDLAKYAGTGFEQADSNDYAIPFLHILQKLSPQVDEENPNHVKGARPGMIYETVSKHLIPGKEGLITIPCAFKKSFVEWKPRDSGGGFVKDHGWNEDLIATCSRDDRGRLVLENGNSYIETKYHYVLIAIDGMLKPAVITMVSSQLKKSRAWMAMMQTRRMKNSSGKDFIPPMFAYTYNLTTVLEQKDQNSWFSWNVTPGQQAMRNEVREAIAFHKAVMAGTVKMVDESPVLVDDDDIPF